MSYVAKNYQWTSKNPVAKAKSAQNTQRNLKAQRTADKHVLTAPSFKVARNRTDT